MWSMVWKGIKKLLELLESDRHGPEAHGFRQHGFDDGIESDESCLEEFAADVVAAVSDVVVADAAAPSGDVIER